MRHVTTRIVKHNVPQALSQGVPNAACGNVRNHVDLPALRAARKAVIDELPETQQLNTFLGQLERGHDACGAANTSRHSLASVSMPSELAMHVLTSGYATLALHVESRAASALGQGFYTIGPCGEEALGSVGAALRPSDASALHYRHLATQVTRQLASGRTLGDVLLDRARGYAVSTGDPVTGGVHCALGGGAYDFIVTSTLASQAPAAVGRALGSGLHSQILGKSGNPKFPKDFVSYVSVGDGSVNNAMFLAATNMAEYAQHRRFRCPAVFGISDNGVCISLRNYDWLPKFLEKLRMPVFQADGNDFLDVWRATQEAFAHSRRRAEPSAVVFRNLARRFGHAGTDRQFAYLSEAEIQAAADHNPLMAMSAQLVSEGLVTYPELVDLLRNTLEQTQKAFDQAAAEPKIMRREEMLAQTCQPLVQVTKPSPAEIIEADSRAGKRQGKLDVMRKHMTRFYGEAMETYRNFVYLGEDVRHGGYYLVSDGLAEKYPMRVMDFPPDETSLMGAGIGYSQAGLLPVVEIPYAKYLDCGADMFFEAAINNWLSAGKCPNGMVVRLQGFDRGVFGGNFHTHNSLHLPPGVDVVCYSNGRDYVRGLRYCLKQAAGGRMVMSVDSTNLLNLRHLHESERDGAWLTRYPEHVEDVLSFDTVICREFVHADGEQQRRCIEVSDDASARDHGGVDVAIVTYGNGVHAAELAQRELTADGAATKGLRVVVVDCPLLSELPSGLVALAQHCQHVVFVDVCKAATGPLDTFVAQLQSQGRLPARWRSISAPRTYNPLGNTVTFINKEDVLKACNDVMVSAA